MLSKEEKQHFNQIVQLLGPVLVQAVRDGINTSVLGQPVREFVTTEPGETLGHRSETVWATAYAAVVNRKMEDGVINFDHNFACAAADLAVKGYEARQRAGVIA